MARSGARAVRDRIEPNKKNAMGFYDLIFIQCEPREVVDQYVGPEYIQHDPHVADGKEAFIDYIDRMAAKYPRGRK